ncbi:MAG: NUDIX hydrolase [Hyphomonadaceae bacterium]|nr:NUDIX hydrolase [Hyphomonadaceae bacterium]
MNYIEPVNCVGVVVIRGDEVLIVRRRNPPNAGAWSIPGGRIEPDEDYEAAVHRELREETRIRAEIVGEITEIDVEFDDVAYRLHDYAAIWTEGEPVAGDDASEARFIHRAQVDDYISWDKTRDVIRDAFAMIPNAKI